MLNTIDTPKPVLNSRIITHSLQFDEFRRYVTDTPSPSKFASLLKDVDAGDIAAMVELNEEMEAKDAHLQGVANARRQAVTALPWSIEPDPNTRFTDKAEVGVKYCRTILNGIRSWEETLKHLVRAIGPGIAATELIWSHGKLVDTNDVPGDRLFRPWGTNTIHVLTDDEPVYGVQAMIPKFVIHTPDNRSGHPLRVTITRAQAYAWIIKHYLIADWSAFTEVFGMPVRVAKLKPGIPEDERDKVEKMLKNMASDTWGLFSDGVDIQIIKGDVGTPPYSELLNWIERKQSILYLGQTLTTEMQSTGSFAAARVHENVKASILLDDIANEAKTIRDQILRPMIQLRFPGQDIPVPIFKRTLYETKNLEADRLAMDQLRLAMELGLPIDKDEAYLRLNLKKPQDGDTNVVLPPAPVGPANSQS